MDIQTHELDKLAKVKDLSQSIGFFIESLPNYGLTICEEAPEGYGLTTQTEDGDEFTSYIPTHQSIEVMLAKYFDIDLKKCEEERQLILASLQN